MVNCSAENVQKHIKVTFFEPCIGSAFALQHTSSSAGTSLSSFKRVSYFKHILEFI